MINNPQIIIADQPENYLDDGTKKNFFLLESLNKLGTTIIMTSNCHNMLSVNYKNLNLERSMINYQEVLEKILLKDEEKFFHGLSFVVISLIALHGFVF